ncbi:putative G-protein coupled receptor 25 [Oryzias melastigma]|uniref:Putative G-protein coupled receptor 25 n=1 Tax=Oryzias melastigma TaxID=30732 RepID=A0A834EY95_ORYME|nr:putative G-protein coupled receptor 25 [Oryzias melastigma]
MEATTDYYYENDYNGTNYTDGSFEDQEVCDSSSFHGSHIFLPVMYYLIFFTGFWGNLFVISVVASKGKRGGRLVDIFVVNLAVADLIFVLTLPLWAISASQNNYWNFGAASNLLCKLSSYIISVNRFSNIFFLTCMSIDRYLVIVKLMDSRHLRSSWCVIGTCISLWMTSLVLGIPSLVYRGVDPEGSQSCLDDKSSTFYQVTNLIMTLLTFVFPVLIIVLCYGTIIMHLNKHCSAVGNPRAEARRRHSLKMVLCIILAFVVSWLPYNIFKTFSIISHLFQPTIGCETQNVLDNGLVVSCCMAFFNSCVNPVIYFVLDNHFRKRAGMLYHSCKGTSNVLQSFNSSTTFTNGSENFGTSGGRSQFQI